ncbi:MAG: hypothetical protein M1438_20745 [Deltaproteobacteria bacterium]|nr:hypothetical protein [Deltaproteobacteria bacterium]
MSDTIRFVVLILIFTFLAGFYIVPTRTMPDNALVLLEEQNKTYFSPSCVPKDKILRPATAAEALRLKYQPDKKCQDASGFRQDSRSLSGRLMERLGMLPPLPSRWNPDGTWNW